MRLHSTAFFSSLFLSRLADQVLLVLVPLVVFQSTHSAAWSGAAFFVETLPRFLAFPVCGALCDRVAPIALLRWSQRGRAAACAAGGVLAFAIQDNVAGVATLVLVSALCGVLTTQGLMAREVMLPHILPNQNFVRVLAHAQIADQLGMVLGPMLAALCMHLAGWQAVVAGTAGIFLAADGLLALWYKTSAVALPVPAPTLGQPMWEPYWRAAQHLWHVPGLSSLVARAAGVNLVVGGTLATGAALLIGVHGRSEADYAWLQAAGALGTVGVLWWIGRAHGRSLQTHCMGRMAFACIAIGGLCMAAASMVSLYVLGYLLVVGCDKMFGVTLRAERQRLIPAQDYGKTSGLMVLLNNLTQPLAGLAVGAWSGVLGATGVIGLLTATMLAVGTGVWLVQRSR